MLLGLLTVVVAVAFNTTVGAEVMSPAPLAEVNGEAISAEDLDQALGAKLRKLEEQIYDLKRRQLDSLIAERLLAQEAVKRGIPIGALLDGEVTSKVGLVTEQDVEAFYQANKARLRGDEAAVRQQVRSYLQQQMLSLERERFVESLRAQARVLVRLPPLPHVRVDVPVDGASFRGPADAPVTLVEFSDFHCPFCRQVQPTLAQLLQRYPGQVRLAYRDFPLDGAHPQARRAAEGARCAREQGKFWEYHDVLFVQPPQAAPEDLKRYAVQVGLDGARFEGCLTEGVHRSAVQRDFDEGVRLGVTGTPTVFVNGRPLSGAQPLEVFVRLIEEELTARKDQSVGAR